MKRNRILLLLALLLPLALQAQESDRRYSAYYYQRASLFEALPTSPDDVLFIGNSITDGGEWFELLDNPNVRNRGISGDTAYGVLDRLDPLLKGTPSKIFLMIGVNDLPRGTAVAEIVRRVSFILNKIKCQSPATEIYLQSVLPMTDEYQAFEGHKARISDVPVLNARLEELAKEHGVAYIDLYSHFVDPATGMLDKAYSNDGLHLMGAGYVHWASLIKPYL